MCLVQPLPCSPQNMVALPPRPPLLHADTAIRISHTLHCSFVSPLGLHNVPSSTTRPLWCRLLHEFLTWANEYNMHRSLASGPCPLSKRRWALPLRRREQSKKRCLTFRRTRKCKNLDTLPFALSSLCPSPHGSHSLAPTSPCGVRLLPERPGQYTGITTRTTQQLHATTLLQRLDDISSDAVAPLSLQRNQRARQL